MANRGRLLVTSLTILSLVLNAGIFGLSQLTASVSGSSLSPPRGVGSGSWNPHVPCSSPWILRISDITDNLTGTNSYNTSPYSPGITENPFVSGSGGAKRWLTPGATPSGWVSPGPSCTITNLKGQTVASFVEIDNVRIGSGYYTETDCSTTFNAVNGGKTYTTGGKKCDVTANIYSSPTDSCTKSTDQGCWYKIHTEFDQDWQGAAYCGP